MYLIEVTLATNKRSLNHHAASGIGRQSCLFCFTPIVLNCTAVRWKYLNRLPLHYRWVGEPQSSSTLPCCCWMGEPKLIELSSTVPGSPIQIVFHCAATGGRTPVIFQDAPLYRPEGLAMHTTKRCVSLGLACLHPGGVVG